MKKLRLISLFCCFLLAGNLFCQPLNTPYDMILTGETVLEDIRFLSMETGITFLSFTTPLAPAEINIFLNKIDESALSDPGIEAYYRVLDRLMPQTLLSWSADWAAVHLNLNAALSGMTRFNTDISLYPRYPEVTQFLTAELRLFFSNSVQLYIEPSFGFKPTEYALNAFSINVPTSYYVSDLADMPLRAFISLGGPFWNFHMGRDRIFWGTANTGSLSFSDNSPFMDFARLSLFSSFLKYSATVVQLPLSISDGLMDTDLNWQAFYPDNIYPSIQRYFYVHRLDFSLFDKVSISLMEGLMVGGSPIELRYLNPFIIFHNLFPWNDYEDWKPAAEKDRMGSWVGSLFSIEANYNIFSNLAVYGQFVMNDYATKDELEEGPQPPDALGFLGGLQFSHTFKDWGSVFFMEFVYTDPYLYILSSPYASMIQMTREDLKQYYFIGYPRDTIALTFGAYFFNEDTLNFSGKFSWIASGQHNDRESTNGLKWNWNLGDEVRSEFTPTGIIQNNLVLSFDINWKPLPYFYIGTNITGILAFNNKHENGNNQFGGQFQLTAGFRL